MSVSWLFPLEADILAHEIYLKLLTRPRHSIINQAFDSRLRLDLRRPINGDGFGVGESSICI